jgi:hypothetical protein
MMFKAGESFKDYRIERILAESALNVSFAANSAKGEKVLVKVFKGEIFCTDDGFTYLKHPREAIVRKANKQGRITMNKLRAVFMVPILSFLILTGCASEIKLWRNVWQRPSITAIDNYLEKYPNGQHVALAKQLKVNIIEDQAWEQAKRIDSLESYAVYLQEYPTGQYADDAKAGRERILDGQAWAIADKVKTIQAYETYMEKFPNGAFVQIAARERDILKENMLWEEAERVPTYKSFSAYLGAFPNGKNAETARQEIPKLFLLSDAEIDQITKWQKAGLENAKSSSNVEKLIFTGANLLDDNAGWADRIRGRKIYDLLKSYNPELLSTAMNRTVLIKVNRLHVLFLVVKLGISGTEKSLNDLLLQYGDKAMAEDYLNSRSEKLHDGGVAWAKANDWVIFKGHGGSSRVGWGIF